MPLQGAFSFECIGAAFDGTVIIPVCRVCQHMSSQHRCLARQKKTRTERKHQLSQILNNLTS